MKENMIKRNPLIPLMNEGLGELKCRRHFVLYSQIPTGFTSILQDITFCFYTA